MRRFFRGIVYPWILIIFSLSNCWSDQIKSFELRGVLLEGGGQPLIVGNVIVQLREPHGPTAFSTPADAKGQFRFRKVPGGIYVLTAFVPRGGRARRTIEIGPSFADGKGRISTTLQMRPRRSRAASFQISATQLFIPEQARAEYDKAQQRAAVHDWSGASQLLRKALDIAPQFSAAWQQLGLIASLEKRYQEAADAFREVLKQQPEYYLALINLGGVLLGLGNAAEANAVNERAVRLRPDDEQAHAQLGYGYLLVGRLAEAETHLKRTIALDPAHYFYPQILLADLYGQRNDTNSVVRELEEFLRLHPDSQKARDVAQIVVRLRSELKKASISSP